MPRNSSGTMTLPSPGVPFQSGTTINSSQVNATLSDLATEISDSASRSGKGGFSAPVRGPDGTVAAPALSFTSEPASGLYRAGANDVRLTVGGVDALKLVAGGVAELDVPTTPSAVVKATGAGAQIWLQGNRTAADTFADVVVIPTVARTAGVAFQIWNGPAASPVAQLSIDYHGLLKLEQPAAAIQPASIWTAITPNANIAGTGGPAYFKDTAGMVHLKGGLTNNTGGVATTFVTTNPLPVGFRPLSARTLPGALTGIGAGSPVSIQVDATGAITTVQNVPNSITLSLDAVSFMAEQ